MYGLAVEIIVQVLLLFLFPLYAFVIVVSPIGSVLSFLYNRPHYHLAVRPQSLSILNDQDPLKMI